jgi:lipoprotein-releasing system ATP-binding protein
MISFQDVHVHYGPLHVIKGISMDIPDGSKTVIIGPSGSGKSTLLRTINNFEAPSKGHVVVNGKEMKRLKSRELYRARQDIGMVFQSFNLYGHMTALENLTLAPMKLKKEPRKQAEERALKNLEAVGLLEKRNVYPAQLSGGQQQRVAIARALSLSPRLILADEPTGNLDTHTADDIFALLREFNRERGSACLIVTHDPRLAARCDRRIELVDGRIARGD